MGADVQAVIPSTTQPKDKELSEVKEFTDFIKFKRWVWKDWLLISGNGMHIRGVWPMTCSDTEIITLSGDGLLLEAN